MRRLAIASFASLADSLFFFSQYDQTTTYGLTAPPYIFAIIVILLNGYFSDKAQNRFWFAVGPVMLVRRSLSCVIFRAFKLTLLAPISLPAARWKRHRRQHPVYCWSVLQHDGKFALHGNLSS